MTPYSSRFRVKIGTWNCEPWT